MENHIISLASFQAGSGGAEALGERLRELLLWARRDSACLACELLQDPEQPQLWKWRGYWLSERALQAYLQLPHMQQLGRWVGSGLIRHMEMHIEACPLGLAS
ncbi:MAG: putative quinol monooxygenase [Pseudomonas sp.]